MQTGVYAIVNLLNGKAYIGSSAVSFARRFRTHRSALQSGVHHSQRLQRAWQKYGSDAFVFSPIEFTKPEDALSIEQRYIDQWKPEYNIALKAGSTLGVKFSDEAKAKISKAAKDAWADPEVRERTVASFKATWADEALKSHLSDAARGRAGRDPFTPELVAEIRNAVNAGESQRAIAARFGISKSVVAKNWCDESHKAGAKARHKQVCSTPEVRSKMSESAKARCATPEGIARMQAARQARRSAR